MTALAEAAAQRLIHVRTLDSELLQQIQKEQPSLTEFLDVLYVFLQQPISTPLFYGHLAAFLLQILGQGRTTNQAAAAAQQQWQRQRLEELQRLDAAVAQELLQQALLKGHAEFLEAAVSELKWQPLAPEYVTAMFKRWFGQEQAYHSSSNAMLLKAAGASDLSTAQLVELLCAAAKATASWRYLCGLPQVQQFTTEQLVEVAVAAVQKCNSELLQLLCSPEQAADMLAAAMKSQHPDVVAMLASKYKRAATAPDALLRMLQSAMQQNSTSLIKALCTMDAAMQLTVATMAGLFRRAVQQQQCDSAAHLLCWFEEWLRQLEEEQQSAAGARTRKQLQQHFSEQQRQQWYQQQLRMAAVLVLLRTAVQQRCSGALSCMCKVTLVQQAVNTPAGIRLLQLAVKLGSSCTEAEDLQAYTALCFLPALKQLQPQQVVDLLLHALHCENTDAVLIISKLPAVRNLAAAENIEQLLQLATDEGLLGPAGKKCKWFAPVAAQLRRLPAAAALQRPARMASRFGCYTTGTSPVIVQSMVTQRRLVLALGTDCCC
jgi:hypothetical protein